MTTKKALLLFLLACIALGSGYFFHKQNLGNHSSQTDTLFTIPLSNLKKETTTLAQYKKWTTEFIDAFEAIDGKLKKDSLPYLCGRIMTIADIIIFNELSQFLFLTKLDFTQEKLATMEKLKQWYTE